MIPEEAVYIACAHAAHEANRAFCAALGDTSQPPWHEAPTWQRDSALNGVEGVLAKGNGPKESHESWMAQKDADGWVWGETKDSEAKRHPCMVPYDQLPEHQRMKDTVFVSTVRTLAAALGYEAPNTRLSMKAVEE